MLEAPFAIPERFQPAYQRIKQLEQEERYLGAFLFGSLARGEAIDITAPLDSAYLLW